MTALNSLSYTSTENVQSSGSVTVAGSNTGVSGGTPIVRAYSLKTGIANASPGGADEQYFGVLTIAASGNATINLGSFTNIAGQVSSAMARAKEWRFWLLGLLQSAPDGTVGTACSGITVGGGSNPFEFNLSGTNTMTIENAGDMVYRGGAAGFTIVSGTNSNVKIVNNDSGNSAVVLVEITGGST